MRYRILDILLYHLKNKDPFVDSLLFMIVGNVHADGYTLLDCHVLIWSRLSPIEDIEVISGIISVKDGYLKMGLILLGSKEELWSRIGKEGFDFVEL